MKPENIMKTGIELIQAERERQVSREGFDAAHDDAHSSGEICRAAGCYLAHAEVQSMLDDPSDPISYAGGLPAFWPWKQGDWKPRDRMRNLIRAGALIAAEIDRIQRADEKGT